MEEILNRLRQLRAYKGLKQGEFSKLLKMPQNTYSQIETGSTPLKDRHISYICLTFGVNEDWLRTGEGEMLIEKPKQTYPDTKAVSFEVSEPIVDQHGKKLTQEEQLFMEKYMKLDDDIKNVARIMVASLLKSQEKETQSKDSEPDESKILHLG
jgi:transcriptional regulator with XRE-family HTH domain